MSAEPSKSLLERRAKLERQLHELIEKGDALYTPGRSVVPERLPEMDEQTELQIEELQAAIAEIDEALKKAL